MLLFIAVIFISFMAGLFTMALLVAGSDNRGETNQNDPEEKPKPYSTDFPLE